MKEVGGRIFFEFLYFLSYCHGAPVHEAAVDRERVIEERGGRVKAMIERARALEHSNVRVL